MATSENQWTIKQLLQWAADDFKKRGIETARLDAEILLSESLSCSRVDLYLRFDQRPGGEALARFREAVMRRRGREPVAHIIGRKSFHEIELMVPAGVFVPRPETEILVDEALQCLRSTGGASLKVVDVGAGSGAVALAIAESEPRAQVLAVDVNPRAAAAVLENARRLGLEGRVTVLEGDLFAGIEESGPFDLIVSNPPYIISAEIDTLMPEVKDHESRLALDGGADGLDCIRRLLDRGPGLLAPGGWLLLEIGEGQAGAVAAMAGSGLEHRTTRRDLRGIERVVIFRKAPGPEA